MKKDFEYKRKFMDMLDDMCIYFISHNLINDAESVPFRMRINEDIVQIFTYHSAEIIRFETVICEAGKEKITISNYYKNISEFIEDQLKRLV